MNRKLKPWVPPAVLAFLCCLVGFGTWYFFEDGKPDATLWITIIIFIVWGIATSLGLKSGVFRK